MQRMLLNRKERQNESQRLIQPQRKRLHGRQMLEDGRHGLGRKHTLPVRHRLHRLLHRLHRPDKLHPKLHIPIIVLD
jgi:hypothetical protein